MRRLFKASSKTSAGSEAESSLHASRTTSELGSHRMSSPSGSSRGSESLLRDEVTLARRDFGLSLSSCDVISTLSEGSLQLSADSGNELKESSCEGGTVDDTKRLEKTLRGPSRGRLFRGRCE